MSELTTCNYCNLRQYRSRAKKEKCRLYVRPSTYSSPNILPGGYDVFIVPKGEKLDTSVDEKGNHGKQWVSWMMEIPDHCVC